MEMEIEPGKTYVSKENVRTAIDKLGFSHLRYFIMKNEKDRYFPVFIGEVALQAGVHFHFNIIG